MEFVKYNDGYKDIVELINKEILSERKVTNISCFDKNNSMLVIVNNEVVGFASVTFNRGIPTIQYGVLKAFRRLGYGTLILDKLTDRLFEEGYNRVELLIAPKNEASVGLAKKVGYCLDVYNNGDVEFNPDNEERMYLTYYKNSYKKIK